jgi:hypothetical protein
MFSVSLNWAIDLRQGGRLPRALQAVLMSSELCARLTAPLAGLLRGLCEHSKHYGTLPNTVPLDPANFQGPREQRSARLSNLLSRVLLSHRQQFLHKVNTLADMVEDLCKHFRMAADELSEGTATDPERSWQAVDADHFDLNTCLREAIVLLKSFLVVLAVDQLGAFQNTVRELSGIHQPLGPSAQDVLRHRRMTQFAGK